MPNFRPMRATIQYYHGKPCKHCGETKRFKTNRHCVHTNAHVARQEYNRRYNATSEKRRERIRLGNRRRRASEKYREQERQYTAKYYDTHPLWRIEKIMKITAKRRRASVAARVTD